MLVRQLVGRYAGEVIDLDYADAVNCIAAKTAELPNARPAKFALTKTLVVGETFNRAIKKLRGAKPKSKARG